MMMGGPTTAPRPLSGLRAGHPSGVALLNIRWPARFAASVGSQSDFVYSRADPGACLTWGRVGLRRFYRTYVPDAVSASGSLTEGGVCSTWGWATSIQTK